MKQVNNYRFFKSEKSIEYFLCAIIVFVGFSPLKMSAQQIFTNQKYIIKKYQLGYALDVRNGSIETRAQIWTFDLNQTATQYFRFIPVGPNWADRIYKIQNVRSNLFVTAKFTLQNVHPDYVGSGNGSNYYITQENELSLNNSPDISMDQIDAKNQYWQLMPTPGLEGVFVIKNIRFGKVLIPNANESKTYLKLASYTPGLAIQRWHIMNIPMIPKVLSVNDFMWKNATGQISGNIKWADNSDNEETFEIWVSHKIDLTTTTWKIATVPANTTQYNFTFPPALSGVSLYCFKIKAKNNNFSSFFSEDYCKVNSSETPPQPTPGTAGFTISDRYSCGNQNISCDGNLTRRMRLNPVNLDNVNVGRTSALEFSLTTSTISQIVNPQVACCVYRYSNLLQQGQQLRPGTWDLQVYNLNTWQTYSRIAFTPGANDIKICTAVPDKGFTKNSPFWPCY